MPDDQAKAKEFVADNFDRPELVVHEGNLPATVWAARDLLAKHASDLRLFERGMPVRLVMPTAGELRPPCAEVLTANYVAMLLHQIARVVKPGQNGVMRETTFPDRAAKMYLDMKGEWGLPRLVGITGAPLLSEDGGIRSVEGYDPRSGLWCMGVPKLEIPERPTRKNAQLSSSCLRWFFRTFSFGDAKVVFDPSLGVPVVEEDSLPGHDESGFMSGFLTAICRPSLLLAPGLLVTSPSATGSGTGKGLCVRSISLIAFGTQPLSFTGGHNKEERDKRIVAEFMAASPMMLLDNLNDTVLDSETLQSVMTERPSQIRPLGQSKMVEIEGAPFISMTGNGLKPGGDLPRRLISCHLDAHMENAEARPFEGGFLERVREHRARLLKHALTIWRFGRQNQHEIKGSTVGSFEVWGRWVRDPLVALGYRDPVERQAELKLSDPRRRRAADLFRSWYHSHGDDLISSAKLDPAVIQVLDPKQDTNEKKSRQKITAEIDALVGTTIAGFTLERQEPQSRWGPALYRVTKVGRMGHRRV
ncbi:MAG TPA: hypothetical protein VLX09_16075 [Stellaceae bacterium]|nr:hypothetical protein [Stellaceae bacterium]